MVRVTRSEESERIRGEREMEESKAEREEGKAVGDVRNVTTQVDSLLSICEAFFFFLYRGYLLMHPHQSPSPRRCKLWVLDLQNTSQNFWSMWSRASSYGCSGSRMAPGTEPRSTTKLHLAPLKVFIDLCLKEKTLDNFLTYFLGWVE